MAWPADSELVPRHGGHPVGSETWTWIFFGCELGAMLLYLCGLVLLRSRPPRLVVVAAIAAAVQLAPLGAPLLLSTDAWTYWDYGRIAAVHDASPYDTPPSAFPRDPAYRHTGTGWRHTTTVYGPAFTLASEPVALVAGSSPDAAAWIFKTLAALAVLGSTALATMLARGKAFACAFVGWNPLLAVHVAGGGHNDAWMTVLVLAAMVLAGRGRLGAAGVAWAVAVLVKWVPLLFLPLRMLEARATGRRVAHLGFGLTVLAIGAVASWRYGTGWLDFLGPIARNANRETRFAIPHRIAGLGIPHGVVVGVLIALFALAYLWLLREARRGRARLGLAAALGLLATPYLAAWYVIWAGPLAAAEEDRTAQVIVLALSCYLVRQTVPL
jgi:hypothetical protein